MTTSFSEAHKHCRLNRRELERSDKCACFYCGLIYQPSQIKAWCDDGTTALCPRCGIDSVIGSASGIELTAQFLNQMNAYWFWRE